MQGYFSKMKLAGALFSFNPIK